MTLVKNFWLSGTPSKLVKSGRGKIIRWYYCPCNCTDLDLAVFTGGPWNTGCNAGGAVLGAGCLTDVNWTVDGHQAVTRDTFSGVFGRELEIARVCAAAGAPAVSAGSNVTFGMSFAWPAAFDPNCALLRVNVAHALEIGSVAVNSGTVTIYDPGTRAPLLYPTSASDFLVPGWHAGTNTVAVTFSVPADDHVETQYTCFLDLAWMQVCYFLG